MAVPSPSFSYDTSLGAAPLTVEFTDTSTGSPDTWSWAFGDGGTSSLENPTHTYTVPGVYDITLEVSNGDGSSGPVVFNDLITVEDPALYPVAAFTAVPTSGPSPLTVNFTDQSTYPVGDPIDYWSYDLVTRTDYTANPNITYTAVGYRTISLTVRTVSGRENTLTKTNYINVTAGAVIAPVANFSATPTTVSAGSSVQFTDLSTNTPTAWAWDFDNSGSTDSTSQNPSFTYTVPGTYAVKLTASNSAGSDIEVKLAYITVSAPVPVAPTANFSGSPTSGNAPLTVTFTDTSTGTPTSWSWDFANDGVYDSTEQNPTHIFSSAGTYTVKLRATNAQGSDTETKTDYITVAAPGLPVVDFTGTPLTGSVPLTVTFTASVTSATPITAYAWDFNNDGTVDSVLAVPLPHVYTRAGQYTVRLSVTNSEGTTVKTRSLYVNAGSSGSGTGGTITVTQGANSATTDFVKGTLAAFYDPERNWLRYGIVSSVTYLSDPTFKIIHKANYVPRHNPVKTDAENYADRRGLLCLAENTTNTNVSNTVESVFAAQGVTVIPAVTGSQVSVNSGAKTSLYAVGARVSALITSINVIVLGRVNAIRYINANPNGTATSGYFRYYIKSWSSGPSGPLLRTYSTNETYVKAPTADVIDLVDLGSVPRPPQNIIVITPLTISGGGTSGNNSTDLLPKTYNLQLSASGGTAPYFFDITDGTIMTGCSLSESGLISGTATTPGTFVFTVRAQDSSIENPSEGFRTYQVNLQSSPDSTDPVFWNDIREAG